MISVVEFDLAYWVQLGRRLQDLSPRKFEELIQGLDRLVTAESEAAAMYPFEQPRPELSKGRH